MAVSDDLMFMYLSHVYPPRDSRFYVSWASLTKSGGLLRGILPGHHLSFLK
jgi:hypothetical protein